MTGQRIRAEITALAILLIPVGALCGVIWWRLTTAFAAFPQLFSNRVYLQLAALYIGLGLWFIVGGFLTARRAPSTLRSGLAVLLGTLVTILGLSDAYIVLARVDTSGPGGDLCLTMRNWWERVVIPEKNSAGYWEREYEPFSRRPANTRVIAVVGDSMTWGQGIPRAQYRFTNVLERTLSSASRPVVVLNAGHGGARTSYIPTIVKHVSVAKPDVIIYAYLTNDIEDYVTRPSLSLPGPKLGMKPLLGSPTYNWIHWQAGVVSPFQQLGMRVIDLFARAYADPAVFGRHLDDVDQVYEAIRAAHATPVLAFVPFHALWTDPAYIDSQSPPGRPTLRETVYRTLAERATRKGVPVLHSEEIELSMSPAKFAVSPGDAHPGIEGHAAIAAALADGIRKAGILDAIAATARE